MKLSRREIELIADIPRSRRRRKAGVWLGFVTALLVFLALPSAGIHWESMSAFIGLMLGVSASQLIGTNFGARPEDRLADVLLRYVNDDPEAIEQLAARPGAREPAV